MNLPGLARRLSACVLVSCAAGCLDGNEVGSSASDAGVRLGSLEAGQPISAELPAPPISLVYEPVSALDILFVIDNSGSMASEQEKLARELTRMVRVLSSGDRYAEREDQVPKDLSEKARRFTPVSSLHVGVVSTNAGGIDQPPGSQPAVLSCAGLGDDGKLQHATEVAVSGVVARNKEFDGYLPGETVIEPSAECQLPAQPSYQSYVTSDDPTAVGLAFRCVARLGVRGCPFEQPLESMWKALAPSTPPPGAPAELYSFREASVGQGDRENQGFLRENAVLAVVILTDEEDCSITDAGEVLFAQTKQGEEFGPINLRCGLNATDKGLVRDTERYVNALRSLKPGHPERVVFTAVIGAPAAAIEAGASFDELLDLPEMQFTENPLKRGFPEPSCASMSDGRLNEAYAGRRFVQVAKALGTQSVIESICAETYGPVIDRVVNKIAPMLAAQ